MVRISAGVNPGVTKDGPFKQHLQPMVPKKKHKVYAAVLKVCLRLITNTLSRQALQQKIHEWINNHYNNNNVYKDDFGRGRSFLYQHTLQREKF